METIKSILFIIGVIFLCLNMLRFLGGIYLALKDPKLSIYLKIFNTIESIGMIIVLIILIVSYYK